MQIYAAGKHNRNRSTEGHPANWKSTHNTHLYRAARLLQLQPLGQQLLPHTLRLGVGRVALGDGDDQGAAGGAGVGHRLARLAEAAAAVWVGGWWGGGDFESSMKL